MAYLKAARLYTFIDTAYLNDRNPVELTKMLCDGGSDVIQLRAKTLPQDRVRHLAESILPVTESMRVPLFINDYPQLALQIGAQGCHLGQEDFFHAGYRTAAQVTGCPPAMRLGLSTHAPAQAQRALRSEPDYIAIGPVYPTATKPSAPPVTLDYVRWAAREIRIPWFAIGGVTLDNLDDVLEAGARRVCVVSAILNADDVARTCQTFKKRLVSMSH